MGGGSAPCSTHPQALFLLCPPQASPLGVPSPTGHWQKEFRQRGKEHQGPRHPPGGCPLFFRLPRSVQLGLIIVAMQLLRARGKAPSAPSRPPFHGVMAAGSPHGPTCRHTAGSLAWAMSPGAAQPQPCLGTSGGLISSTGHKLSIPPCPKCLQSLLQHPQGLCCTEGPVGSSTTHRTQIPPPSRHTNNQETGCGHHRTSSQRLSPTTTKCFPSTKPRTACLSPAPSASRAASDQTSASFTAPGRLRC